MKINDIGAKAKEALSALTELKVIGVIGISRDENGWKVLVEVVEKTSIPDIMDILGIYEVSLDKSGEVTGFERKYLRKRGDTENKESV